MNLMADHYVILTRETYYRLLKTSKYAQRFGLECHRCRRKFFIGEKILSHKGGGKSKYYCLACAKDLYYIPIHIKV